MNDEKRISVVLVKAGCKAQLLEITGSLKSMQNIVKGNIEMVMPFDDDAALIVNEEGKIRGLPLNRALYDSKGTLADVIAGDFFICRAPDDSDGFESLTDKQKEKYMKMFAEPEKITATHRGIIVSKSEKDTQIYVR